MTQMFQSDCLSLAANIEILLFVGWYSWRLHKLEIETTASEDKIIITMLLYAFIGVSKYAYLLIGNAQDDPRVDFLSLMGVICIMVVGACIGMSYHQRIKDYTKQHGHSTTSDKSKTEGKAQGNPFQKESEPSKG